MKDKPDTAARLTFIAIQTLIVFVWLFSIVANRLFSWSFEGRFQRGFLYGLPNVGYYNSKARARTRVKVRTRKLSLDHLVGASEQ